MLNVSVAEARKGKGGDQASPRSSVKQTEVYMFGYAVSFMDSLVYITDVQPVAGVTIEKKTRFLMDRQLYSLQLQQHLEGQQPNRHYTTALFFGCNQKAIDKKRLEVAKQHTTARDMKVNFLHQDAFTFHREEYIEPTIYHPEAESVPATEEESEDQTEQ